MEPAAGSYGMRGRLRVIVATTDGPSTVRRITVEDPELRSVVCLAGTATALPISAEYDAFVRRPTGVVERDTGHRVFRVDVDRPIDEGRSWQLGLYIAHRLKAAGRLAEDDAPADGIVWATGTVDSDLKVGPVERVADKARRSASVRTAGLPVLAVAAADHAEDLPAGVAPLPVRSVGEVLARLDLAAPVERRRRRNGLLIALVLGAVAVGWGLWQAPWPRQERVTTVPAAAPDTVPSFDPSRVAFEVLQSRRVGETCGPAEPADPRTEGLRGICVVAFRAANGGAVPVHLWLYAAVEGPVREYAARLHLTDQSAVVLAPGEAAEVRVRPPDWVRRPVGLRGLLVLAETDLPQVAEAFAGIDQLSGSQIDGLVADWRARGIEVRAVSHRVIPAP
jgi:hypothetical protein